MYQLCLATGFLYGQIPSILTSLYTYDPYPYNLFYAIYSTLNISLLFFFFTQSKYLQMWMIETTFQNSSSKWHWGLYFSFGLFNELIMYTNYQFFYPFLYIHDSVKQQCVANPYPSQRIFVAPLLVFLCGYAYDASRITAKLCTTYMTHIIMQHPYRRARSNSPFAVVDDMLD